jgi:hypothetical protein
MSEITSRVAELSQRVDDLKVPPHSLEGITVPGTISPISSTRRIFTATTTR